MSEHFEIRAMRPFTQEEIGPILTGYETQEIYAVEKTETDPRTAFDIHLVQLEKPYRAAFYQDFTPEECQWYVSLIPKGYCFGAYKNDRLIGFALGEALVEKHVLRVWEFHVMAEFRRMGVGRALMEQEIAKARYDGLPKIRLETQNTNVSAIRFYRSMGFSLEALDFSPSHYNNTSDIEIKQVAFYMELKLEGTS